MKYELLQERSGFSAAFALVYQGERIAAASMRNNLTFNFSWVVSFEAPGGHVYKYVNGNRETKNADGQRLILPVSIVGERGDTVGRIAQLRSHGGILRSFDYYETVIFSSVYNTYPVGMGKDGLKFPIYRNERQEALIEKDILVNDNLDNYNIFALNERAALAGTLTALYIDSAVFARRGKVVSSAIDKTYMRTTNKNLLSKYDPLFVTSC